MGTRRPIGWIHLPVRVTATTRLFRAVKSFGCRKDRALSSSYMPRTVRGAARRIAAAVESAPSFGIGTECGLGRRDPATIPALLALHSELAAQ